MAAIATTTVELVATTPSRSRRAEAPTRGGKGSYARETVSLFTHRSAEEKEEGKPTDEVRVIRRELIVQLDGVRLVYGVPERGPASKDGVDVFRVGGPVTGIRRLLAGVT